MTDAFEQALRQYDFTFPDSLIAQEPASPRDSARLLVHARKTGKTEWAVFSEIESFLDPRSVLVLNETKVIPAKMLLARSTGGTVSALSLGAMGDVIRVMANRKLKQGEFLSLHEEVGFMVAGQDEKYWLLRPTFPMADLDKMFEAHGTMPLPPYIKRSPLSREKLREEYQTVFAKNAGSVAAPTASLHFTDHLLAALQKHGIRIARVTLHVHLGTFATLTEEQWQTGVLHRESYAIDAQTSALLSSSKNAGDPIVAVGTTAVRTLETAFDEKGTCVRPSGETDLFIREGYAFKMVDALITNFHVPKSSLLMLVSAFAGRETVMDLYRQAIEREFRLFSFGDAMLIL